MRKINNILMLSAVSLVLLQTTSCYKDSEEDLYGVDGGCDTSTVSYQTDVVPIVERFCYACHGTTTHASLGSGIELEGYDNIKVWASSGTLLSAIQRDGSASFMPKNSGKLSDCNISIISKWISDGVENN